MLDNYRHDAAARLSSYERAQRDIIERAETLVESWWNAISLLAENMAEICATYTNCLLPEVIHEELCLQMRPLLHTFRAITEHTDELDVHVRHHAQAILVERFTEGVYTPSVCLFLERLARFRQ